MRKWKPSHIPDTENWAVLHQVVVPKIYQTEIVRNDHEIPLGMIT